MTRIRVSIDGTETILTYAHCSGSRGNEWHTPNHTASHSFNFALSELPIGHTFWTNGHTYVILGKA